MSGRHHTMTWKMNFVDNQEPECNLGRSLRATFHSSRRGGCVHLPDIVSSNIQPRIPHSQDDLEDMKDGQSQIRQIRALVLLCYFGSKLLEADSIPSPYKSSFFIFTRKETNRMKVLCVRCCRSFNRWCISGFLYVANISIITLVI